uniref:Protein phosphatase n=1 Tax=Chromera velia CCMP2878 TaxID=1169474 RepID=A0A0G4I7S0_9ALVE|eukprot:Cvel_11766.t1-p1 / transcript=Cvel_11766.t1 / gene=Cvel_11766 / organism=Chromera_velia_CCMP2878 / gene_product=hypothetical protein / transcript_product=hypothetical protein / location=Cvel_scaffold748:22778-27856(+) / protein_length=773 / sequence_SO=supercontig / SO=protein_coding / is_pseudo=false
MAYNRWNKGAWGSATPVFWAGGITATHPHKKMDLMKFDLPSLQDGDDCNDDAWLLSETASILVICDGIGSLRLHNLNGFQLPCEVARELISQRIRNRRPFPKDDLPATVYRSLVEREEVGATTVMLAYLTESGALQTFNMGDSGWVLLRMKRAGEKTAGLEIVGRSKETSKSFNEPLQLCTVTRGTSFPSGGSADVQNQQRGGMGMGGRPQPLSVDGQISISAAAGPWESELWGNCQNADMQLVATAPGDILIGFSDGLSDNVSDDEILQIASKWLKTAAEKGEEGPPNPDALALALAREAFRKGCKYSWAEMDEHLYDPHLMDFGWPAARPDWQTAFVKEFARRHPRQDGKQAMGGKPDDITVTVCVIDSAEALKGRGRGVHGDESGGRQPRLPLHHPRSTSGSNPGVGPHIRTPASSSHTHASSQLSDEHHLTPNSAASCSVPTEGPASGLWTVESSTGKPFPPLPSDSERWGLLGNCSDEALLAAGYARGDPLMPRYSAPPRLAGHHPHASSGSGQSLTPPQSSGRGQASQPAVQLPLRHPRRDEVPSTGTVSQAEIGHERSGSGIYKVPSSKGGVWHHSPKGVGSPQGATQARSSFYMPGPAGDKDDQPDAPDSRTVGKRGGQSPMGGLSSPQCPSSPSPSARATTPGGSNYPKYLPTGAGGDGLAGSMRKASESSAITAVLDALGGNGRFDLQPSDIDSDTLEETLEDFIIDETTGLVRSPTHGPDRDRTGRSSRDVGGRPPGGGPLVSPPRQSVARRASQGSVIQHE